MSDRRPGIIARITLVIAAVPLALTLLKACLCVATTWDVWYYHLPWAARLTGIDSPGDVRFEPINEERYRGFPVLAEIVQGVLWRVTGRAEATNLLAWASVPALAYVMKRLFAVPFGICALAYMAIPVVLLHMTSAYVDLPANACVAALAAVTLGVLLDRASLSRRRLIFAIVCAFGAAASKLQLWPITAFLLVVLAVRAGRAAWPIAVSLPLVFYVPIRNLIVFRNPAYTVETTVLGHTFPGVETPYVEAPDYLAHTVQPVRWLASLMEARLPRSAERWSVDQFFPPETGANRMGGYFVVYVVFAVAAFAALIAMAPADERGKARRTGLFFLAITIITAFSPQSHILRYYMYWMMTLVGFAIVLAKSRGPYGLLYANSVAGGTLLSALGMLHAAPVIPVRYSTSDLIAEHVDSAAAVRVPDGSSVCVYREPWSYLYAARFHGRHYRLTIGSGADCRGDPPLP